MIPVRLVRDDLASGWRFAWREGRGRHSCFACDDEAEAESALANLNNRRAADGRPLLGPLALVEDQT